MYFISMRKIFFSLLILIVGVGLSACGGAGSGTVDIADTVALGPVRGRVLLDSPLVGATVELRSRDGKTLRGTAVTDENGRYEIATDDARYAMQVRASGGRTHKGEFVGKVTAYVEPFMTDYAVNLSAVTTLADRYREVSGLAYGLVQRRIQTYLNLTPGRSIYADFTHARDFSSATFMNRSRELGFDFFVEVLVNEAMASETAKHPFLPLLQGWENDLASEVAMDLVKKAAQFAGPVGDVVVNWAAGQLMSLVTGGKNDAAIAVVYEKLQEISTKLNVLQTTVDALRKDVAELKVLDGLRVLEETINNIRTAMRKLEALQQSTGADRESKRIELEEFIEKSLDDTKIELISNVMNGLVTYGYSPVRSYASYLATSQKFWGQAEVNKMVNFVEYYDALNVQMYYLRIEAANSKSIRTTGNYSKDVPDLVNTLEEGRKKYLALVPKDLPSEDTFIELLNKRMWWGGVHTQWKNFDKVLGMMPDKLKLAYSDWKLPQNGINFDSFSVGKMLLAGNGFPAAIVIDESKGVNTSIASIYPRRYGMYPYIGCDQYVTDGGSFCNEMGCFPQQPDIYQICADMNLMSGRLNVVKYFIPRGNPADLATNFFTYRDLSSDEIGDYFPWGN